MKVVAIRTRPPRFLTKLEYYTMITTISNPASKMKRQLCQQLARPKKNIDQLLLRRPASMAGKGTSDDAMTLLESCSEDSKESLLAQFNADNFKEVPKGFLAVYVGPELRRFVIPMTCLSMPDFRVLMDQAAEEFGFEQQGGLQIPCDEEDFTMTLLTCLAKDKKITKRI